MDTGAALYAWVEISTIKAVVEAYADGEVELPYDKKTTEDRTRYAPSFVAGGSSRHGRHDHPYSPRSVAKFIGWVALDGRAQHKVHVALNALELMEQGYLKIDDFADLTT